MLDEGREDSPEPGDSHYLVFSCPRLFYGILIDYVNSTDVPICRHSSRLWAWSSSSPLIFLQNTRCLTHTYHSRWQKFCCCRTACVEQFTGYYKTDHQLWTVLATSEKFIGPRNHSALWLLIIVRLETFAGVLSTVDMVVQRRGGPRRLRKHDDDDYYYCALYKYSYLLTMCRRHYVFGLFIRLCMHVCACLDTGILQLAFHWHWHWCDIFIVHFYYNASFESPCCPKLRHHFEFI